MAGTAINPAHVAGMDIASGTGLTPSLVNSFRIATVAERLALHVRGLHKNDATEFFNLCISLARGIDFAVVNNEVPSRVQDLPILLKQVCLCKRDSLLQAAIMVLMISVKNACKIGWFPAKDSEELLALANEIGSSFCSVRDLNTEVSCALQTISTIMSRFYPRMKMGQILAFLEVKPGYGTFVIDFHISKNAKSSAEDKIRLFVAQLDNIETSSCIISPPQVNFLLNGKGVERRTNVFMDTGPQLPTVMHMLKYGTNLLQAVGEFNGNYVIVIAYMSVFSNPDNPVLQDYVLPALAAPDSDSEIMEGPSRISLNCPISFRRIKTPVKGQSCKHHQCFDFDNFVDINSRRPSWRCPQCNRYVCYIDIRIDQNMVKVLKEAGENVVDVIISADGSWKAVVESNDKTDQPNYKTSNCQEDGPVQQKATSSSNSPPDIMDLTQGDDDMDVVHTCETQDRKPILANLQSQSSVTNQTIHEGMNNASEVNQNVAHIEDDFWSGIFLSTCGSGASSGRSDATTDFMQSPVLTDADSLALNREPEAFHGTTLLATSIPRSQISAPSNLQLQQSQFGNSFVSNEYGRVPSIPRHINRTPIAIQALPAQTLASIPQERPRNSFNTLTHHQGPSLASQTTAVPTIADGFNSTSSSIERQHQFSRSRLNPLQVSQMTSPSLQQHSTTQVVGLPASSQLPSAYRVSSVLTSEQQNSHQQQPLNPRVSSSQIWSSVQLSNFPRTQIPYGRAPQSGARQTGVTGSSQRLMVSAPQASQMARVSPSAPVPIQTPRTSPSFPVNADGFGASVGDQRGNMGGTSQPAIRTDVLADLTAEQNWQPTGRMRGSLSGRAYSDAFNQFIIQPTQPVQPARPPLNMTLPPPGLPPPLHGLMTNSRNAHTSQTANYPPTEPTSVAGGSGVLPERPSGIHGC